MTERIRLYILMFSTILLLPSAHMDNAMAHRQHQAHVHGVAQLNIAVEGDNLSIELISPAANIVGFEHQPRTDRQKAAVKQAEEKLMAGATLFGLPPGARGRLIRAAVRSDMAPHGDPEQHGHDHAHTHDHGHKDSGKDHSHDHDSAHDHHIHSDFTAEYQFVCEDPKQLTHLDVRLFDIFPGIETIQVQLITGTRQTGQTLTAGNSRISL